MREGTTAVIGMDLGDRRSELCILGMDEKLQREKLATTRSALQAFFSKRERCRVVMEAGTHSGWAADALSSLGYEVVVANPRRVEAISKNLKKSDRNDAELLARMGRADVKLLSPIQHRDRDYHRDLLLLRSRDVLVRCRTRLVTSARNLAKSMGERFPSCDPDVFHRHRDAIPAHLRIALEPLFDQVGRLTDSIAELDKQLEAMAEARYPETKKLTAIFGIGPVTALAFIITLGDPKRFASSRSVGAYFGLCPRSHSSSESAPQLGITKAGDGYVRRLLVNAGVTTLKRYAPESDLRTWAMKLAARGGKRAKNVARVAVARKLAVLMHRMLITGEDYKANGYRKPMP